MTNVQSPLLNIEGIPMNMFGGSFDINKLEVNGRSRQAFRRTLSEGFWDCGVTTCECLPLI